MTTNPSSENAGAAQLPIARTATAPRKYDDDEPYISPGLDGVLAASENLLAVNRGLKGPDERDSLVFKRFYPTPALLRERVALDPGKTIRKQLMQAARRRNLQGWAPFALDELMSGHLIGSPLSSPLEEINPLHLVEQSRRVTQMGPGGIGSANAITDSMQAIHTSQFGYLSPLEGPECHTGATLVQTNHGWLTWEKVVEMADDDQEVLFLTLVDGSAEFRPAEQIICDPYEGVMYRLHNGQCGLDVTPNHRLWYTTRTMAETRQLNTLTDALGDLKGGIYFMGAMPLPGIREFEMLGSHLKCYDFSGRVYCATVPGGLLLTKLTEDDMAIWSGNSERIGVDARLAWGVKLGNNGRIYQKFRDRRSGRMRWVSPRDLDGKVVAVPD